MTETPEELRRRAALIESRMCTGLAASWCPVHGECACPRNAGGEPLGNLDDEACPLHRYGSNHAAGAHA